MPQGGYFGEKIKKKIITLIAIFLMLSFVMTSSPWWLRSPADSNVGSSIINEYGEMSAASVYYNTKGVVPVIRIQP